MIKVILKDNTIYEGEIAEDIIQQLKLQDWTPYHNQNEYKENICRRVKQFNGETLSYNTDIEFLQELQRINFIRDIEVSFP